MMAYNDNLPGLQQSFDEMAPSFKLFTKVALIKEGRYSHSQADEIVDLTCKAVSDAIACIERTAHLGSDFIVNTQILLLATQLLPTVASMSHKAIKDVVEQEFGVKIKNMGDKN